MKHFQPSPKCGNCTSFRKSVKTKDKVVTDYAGCRKDNDPKTCPPEDFKPRGKKSKQKPRKRKIWQERD